MRLGVWAKQSGQGCDYTIGCGETLINLESTNLVDARAEAIEAMRDRGCFPNSERELEEIIIVQYLDRIDPQDIAEEEEVVEEDSETAARRHLYETLKREFG